MRRERAPPAPSRRASVRGWSLRHHQVVAVDDAIEKPIAELGFDLRAAEPQDAAYLVRAVYGKAAGERRAVEGGDLHRIAGEEAPDHLAHARRQEALLPGEDRLARPVVDAQLPAGLEVEHPTLAEPAPLAQCEDERADVFALEKAGKDPRLARNDGARDARLARPPRRSQLGDHAARTGA